MPSSTSNTHLPRRTGEVRFVGRHREDAAVPEQSSARLIRVSNPREARARHTGDPVVTSQALVDERVVGGQELDHGTVLFYEVQEEKLCLPVHRVGERLIEVGIPESVRLDFGEILEP